jgi:hypothetical protein
MPDESQGTMPDVFDYPLVILIGSFVLFLASTWLGSVAHQRRSEDTDKADDDFSFVLGATLTLLGLLIGFTFSMAVGRYDQRKSLEEAEANAIGTEYVRLDLMPAGDAENVRALLRRYLDQRILFYKVREGPELQRADAEAAKLQGVMWSVVATHASSQPTQIAALVVTGMNDVLNAQGYTQAAFWNRIPRAAWLLLMVISVFCNVMVGFRAHTRRASSFLVLPIALSVTLFLMADIESPRGGVIRVNPQNLEATAEQMRPR